MKKALWLNLQLFADAGAAGAATTGESGGDAGQARNPDGLKDRLAKAKAAVEAESAAAVTTPTADTTQTTQEATEQAEQSFDELIKGKYKDDYDKRVQDAIAKRFKNHKTLEDTVSKVNPILEALAGRYGKEASDLDGIMSAMDSDSSYFVDYALEHGVSEDEARRIYKLERDNKMMLREKQQAQQESETRQKFAALTQAAEKTKQIFPQFDLAVEMQNPEFAKLIINNIDPTTAYKAVHHDDIITASVQMATKQAAAAVQQTKVANQERPTEGALSNQATATFDSNPRNMTPEQRADALRRIKAGGKLPF